MPITNAGAVVVQKVLPRSVGCRMPLSAGVRRNLVQGLSLLAAAVLSYWVISHFLVQSVEVVGSSMWPTLRNSERFLLNRWVYYARPPQAGDIVVIRDPSDGGLSVKRIVAGPGDTVHLVAGKIFINDREPSEPYLAPRTHTFPDGKLKEQWLRCQKGQYVVLGDNRMNSADSRCYGPVPRRNILGLLIR